MTQNTDNGLITQLEALSLRTWPALETRYYDGWIMRFADGLTRRSNSIYPVFSSSFPLADKITFCEAAYQAHKQPSIFRISPAVLPAELDVELKARDYHSEGLTQVMTLDLAGRQALIQPDIQHSPNPNLPWLQAYTLLNPSDLSRQQGFGRLMASILPVRQFVRVNNADNLPAGIALGVVDGPWLTIYDLVVLESERRKGYARALLDALFVWGMKHGATQACLQVDADNEPAISLYKSMGFVPRYHYWYRVRDLSEV